MYAFGRRHFLKLASAGAGMLGSAAFARTSFADDDAHSAHVPAADVPAQDTHGADEMDTHHSAGIDVYLENIGQDPTFWRQPAMEYTLDGDVKVFELTCTEMDWDTGGGIMVAALAYNAMVPGPEIRVTEGDTVRINVTNQMTQSTSVHFHGVMLPNNMDGVPFITQPPIRPGETFTYEFTTRNSGSHMYHSHHNAAEQVTRGLMGAFIIEPSDTSREPEIDADYTMILNDSGVGFTINGKGFPYTQPISAKLNDKIRVRYMNEGLMIHPMHLHGMPQLVFAKDGYNLPVPYLCDTLNIAPGERYDVIVDCTELGVWAFHCHILSHAESRNGMFGMVTTLIIEE